MPGLDIEEKLDVAATTPVAEVKTEVKTEAKAKPSASKTLVITKAYTITAKGKARTLEPHLKGYAQGKKLTFTLVDDDTLKVAGDDVSATVRDYILRYSDVTKVE